MKSSGEVKLFIGILVVAVGLVAMVMVATKMGGDAPTIHAPPKPVKVTREKLMPEGSFRLGDEKLPFTLVEFGDYVCPSCKNAKPIVQKLLTDNKHRLSYVFHPLQVVEKHANAPLLNAAAEAASQQGKLWPMHEAMFNMQESFEQIESVGAMQMVMKLAGEQKLDVLLFRSAITSESVIKKAEAKQNLAERLQITTTPTWYFIPPKGDPMLIVGIENLKKYLEDPKSWKQG